jgi:predicted ribosome-associated RNA-binding protein Tma20
MTICSNVFNAFLIIVLYHDFFMGSCYALHCAPQALCRVVLVYPGLEKQICRGADLFVPGVAKPDDEEFAPHIPWPNILFRGKVKRGELCCLASTSSPWAPYAVGRFHRSSEDFLVTGMHGVAVEIIHYQGDALWELGSKTLPSTSPPSTLISALNEKQRKEEEKAQLVREREVAALVAKKAARLEEIPRLIRKIEKTLRQVKDLIAKEQAGTSLDGDQKEKVRKEASLIQEKADLEKELEDINNPLPREGSEVVRCYDGDDGASGGELVDNDDNGIVSTSNGDDGDEIVENDTSEHAAAESDDVEDYVEDEIGGGLEDFEEDQSITDDTQKSNGITFLCAFFTELSLQPPSITAPLLISTLFGKSSVRAGGVGVKQTSWKSSSRFLDEAVPQGAVLLRETVVSKAKGKQKKGDVGSGEVIGFNSTLCPPFTMIDLPSTSSPDKSRIVATKKGGKQVVVSAKRVRNNNVTVIDGLEDWGIDKKVKKHKPNRVTLRVTLSFFCGVDCTFFAFCL